jgi:hypothetical protein
MEGWIRSRRKGPFLKPQRLSAEDRLIEILDRELARAHAKEDFLAGKVERLELAMATFSNAPAKAYVDRTDAKPPIEAVVAEPVKKSWKQMQQEWATMSDEDKEKALKGAPQ